MTHLAAARDVCDHQAPRKVLHRGKRSAIRGRDHRAVPSAFLGDGKVRSGRDMGRVVQQSVLLSRLARRFGATRPAADVLYVYRGCGPSTKELSSSASAEFAFDR